MKEVKMPSGAILKIQLAPFADSKALYQAVLEEVKGLKIDASQNIDVNLFKDIFCAGFSSKKIESALNKCMEKVLYNDLRISDDTWEKVSAREDYMIACFEVVKENLLPFTKSLSAQYALVLGQLKNGLA
jgi:hypothetical protein